VTLTRKRHRGNSQRQGNKPVSQTVTLRRENKYVRDRKLGNKVVVCLQLDSDNWQIQSSVKARSIGRPVITFTHKMYHYLCDFKIFFSM